jgi:hypothetical protein
MPTMNKHIQPPDLKDATGESDLTDVERSRLKRLRREMHRLRLSGRSRPGRSRLSDRQCLEFEGVIHRLEALPEEQRRVFKGGLTGWKSHLPIWQALQVRPTPKQMQDSIKNLRECLDAIVEFQHSRDRADVAVRDLILGDYLAPELADTEEEDALFGGHLDVAEWLANAKKVNELVERHEGNIHACAKEPKKAGPVPIAPRARLIGIYLPDLYTKVFGGKYVPTRAPEIEFVKTCLALMGEKPANDESYIQDCFKLAGKRRREFCS